MPRITCFSGPLRYSTMKPDMLKIEPLTGGKPVSAEKVKTLK